MNNRELYQEIIELLERRRPELPAEEFIVISRVRDGGFIWWLARG